MSRAVKAFLLIIAIVGSSVVYAAESENVHLTVGKSTVINTGAPIARVSLSSSDIADVVVTSTSEVLLNGKAPGSISMFVWDRGGAIRRYDVVVQRDLGRLQDQLRQLFPGEGIAAQSNGKSIVLTGGVSSKAVIENAVSVAAGYVEKKDDVVNMLQLAETAASNQVLLRVRFAEVSRSALTELGSSFVTSPLGVKNTLARVTTEQFAAPGFADLKWTKESDKFGAPVTSAEGKFTFSDFLNFFVLSEKYDLGMMIRALQSRGLFQSLAEPNLVAESGKEASFLAGGEIPVPIAQPSGGSVAVTIMYKEFGIRLNFTPTISGERVHLKVRPEVSTLDFNNAVVLAGFRIPALATRRTETELELQNGQTFAIAGLINNQMNKSLQKVPGIGDIPILGLLFRSEAAQKDRTELVVMITPEILPRNSRGVTSEVPRLQEPYLPALPQNKSLQPPPPAFTPASRSGADNRQQAQPAKGSSKPAKAGEPDPAAAAESMKALTPNGRPIVNAPANRDAATTRTDSGASASRPLTREEQATLERIQKMEHEQQQRAAKSGGSSAADAKKRGEADRKRLEEEKKQAQEAKRRAEAERVANEAAARRNAEIARKQAELEKKKQKAIAEAEAKVKAAQAEYEAELARAKKQQQQDR